MSIDGIGKARFRVVVFFRYVDRRDDHRCSTGAVPEGKGYSPKVNGSHIQDMGNGCSR